MKLIINCFLFVFIFTGIENIHAQDINLTSNDSTVIDPETFDLSQISLKSAELTLKAKNIVRKAINKKEMERLRKENEAVILFTDSLLVRESYVNLNNLSLRNLSSKLLYWGQNHTTIQDRQSELSDLFRELNESNKYLDSELKIWEKTDEIVQEDDLANAVHKHFVKIKSTIDSTKFALNKKRTEILFLLDRISGLDVQIESLVTRIEDVILSKQENIFITDQLTLFRLDYSNKSMWAIPESFIKYYYGNYIYLRDYFNKHIGNYVFHLIYIITLIILFIRLNKVKISVPKGEGSFYVKRLKVLISNPISIALIIGLFASVVIYPYRPLLFLDLSRSLVIIPIVIVLVNILPKKYHIYAYGFGLLVILHIIFLNLPANHIIARLVLLLVTFIEVLLLLHFLNSLRKSTDLKSNNLKFIKLITYILLGLSISGFLANIFGKVTFSVYSVEGILGIILATILVSFSLVIANGLIVLLIDSKYGDQLNIIKNNKKEAKKKITRFFNIIAIIMLSYFILGVFKLQTIIIDSLTEFFLDERNIGSVVFTWGNIVIFFLVIYLSIVIADFIRTLLEEDILKKMKMKKGVPYTIALMVKYTLVTMGIFLAVSAAGIPTNNLTVIIGAFGVGIGFGLQNIFNNLVSGLILLFERPIKIDDTIEVGTLMGNVKSIGIRASNVRTFDGAEIIVPNGNLISNEVVNWTLSDQTRRIEVIVGVSYSSDPHQVQEILLKVLQDHKDIVKDPAPNVFFRELGESSLDFRCLCWTPQFDQWVRIKSEIIFGVFDALKEANIEIPFPQRDLHVRSIDKNAEISVETSSTEKKSKPNKGGNE